MGPKASHKPYNNRLQKDFPLNNTCKFDPYIPPDLIYSCPYLYLFYDTIRRVYSVIRIRIIAPIYPLEQGLGNISWNRLVRSSCVRLIPNL